MAERGNCNGTVYVIKEKDTLYQIAKQYNVSVREIMRQNPYVNIILFCDLLQGIFFLS